MFKTQTTILLVLLTQTTLSTINKDNKEFNASENTIFENFERHHSGEIYVKQQKDENEPTELLDLFNVSKKNQKDFHDYLIGNTSVETLTTLNDLILAEKLGEGLQSCGDGDLPELTWNDTTKKNENFVGVNVIKEICSKIKIADEANCKLVKAIKNKITSATRKYGIDDDDLEKLINKEENDQSKISSNSIYKITDNKTAYFNLAINTGYLIKTMKINHFEEIYFKSENKFPRDINLPNKNINKINKSYQNLCYKTLINLLTQSENAKLYYSIQTYEIGEISNYNKWRTEWDSYIPQYIPQYMQSNVVFNEKRTLNQDLSNGNSFYVQRVSDINLIKGFGVDVPKVSLPSGGKLNCFSFSNYQDGVRMCDFSNNNHLI